MSKSFKSYKIVRTNAVKINSKLQLWIYRQLIKIKVYNVKFSMFSKASVSYFLVTEKNLINKTLIFTWVSNQTTIHFTVRLKIFTKTRKYYTNSLLHLKNEIFNLYMNVNRPLCPCNYYPITTIKLLNKRPQ